MRIGWSAPGSFGVWTRHYHHRRFLWESGAVGVPMRGTCAGSCWTRGQSGFYGTLGTVGSLVRARDVAIMKRVPGGFLPPLRRPAASRVGWHAASCGRLAVTGGPALWPPGRDTSNGRSFESYSRPGSPRAPLRLARRRPLRRLQLLHVVRARIARRPTISYAGVIVWRWTVWIYLKCVVTLSRCYIKTFMQHRWATVLPRCFALGRTSTTRGSRESFPSFHSRWTQLRQWAPSLRRAGTEPWHRTSQLPRTGTSSSSTLGPHISLALCAGQSVLFFEGVDPPSRRPPWMSPALPHFACHLTQWAPPRHPLGLRAALATGIMFCMREIELSHLKVKHVKFDVSLQTVTLYLPSSKTDCAGTGRSRSMGVLVRRWPSSARSTSCPRISTTFASGSRPYRRTCRCFRLRPGRSS